jgi:hypothetical protein
VQWSIADNVSATLGLDGGRPSSSPWIDLIRLAFARTATASPLQEGFTPAAHDTRWSHFSANLQALCDSLAARGAADARPLTYPFPAITADTCFLFHHQHLVADISTALDAAYDACHPLPAAITPSIPCPPHHAWRHAVESNQIASAGLRFAFLARSALLLPTIPKPKFHCSYCNVPCHGWGSHMLRDCPLVAGGVLYAFHAAAQSLSAAGHLVTWTSPSSFHTHHPVHLHHRWHLCCDADLPTQPPHTIAVTWSGLIWPLSPQPPPSTLYAGVCRAYLNAIAAWLQAEPLHRWDMLLQTAPPTADPSGLTMPVPTLATIFAWLLDCPTPNLLGPDAHHVSHLRPPSTAHPLSPVIGCNTLLSPPLTSRPTISILYPQPASSSPLQQLIHLRGGVTLVSPVGALPAIVRRSLDIFLPPPEALVSPLLWLDDQPTDPAPPAATPWDSSGPSSDTDDGDDNSSSTSTVPDFDGQW